MLILGVLFLTILIIGRFLGVLTVENIRALLEYAQNIDPIWVFMAVIILLFLDMFITIPTLTTTLLAGFFIGFPLGALAAFLGMMLALLTGYSLSRIWGERAIGLILRQQKDRDDMKKAFLKNGPLMIVLHGLCPCYRKFLPVWQELRKMRFGLYSVLAMLSTLPFALIGAYAGSVSSIESPQPAIFAAFGLYALLGAGWYVFKRFILPDR